MTAETDIAAIDDGGANTAAEVRTALTSVLNRADAFSGASVYRATTDQAISSATATTIQFNGEEWDTDAYHDNATNNTRLTVPTSGKYRIEGFITFKNTDATDRQVRLKKNGTIIKYFYRRDSASAYTHEAFSFSMIVEASAGSDYFEIEVYQASGAFDVRYGTDFTCVQITRVD